MKDTPKARYKTLNWPEYNKALKCRGQIDIWFSKDLKWIMPAQGKHGRNRIYSDAAIQCCLMLKVLLQFLLRQATGFVESPIKLSGLSWPAPDYSTLSRRQKTIDIQIPHQKSQQGLHLLVDSTGIKILGEGEWKRKKHKAEYRRQWRKINIGIDATTLQIRAVEVTSNSVGDSEVLPNLLDQIPESEKIIAVYGDGAYDTKQCYKAIINRGATPIIPPRKNAQIWKSFQPYAEARNEAVSLVKKVGVNVWKKWSNYHCRSLVETKMLCIKRLGERLMSRDFDRQINEVHARIAVLNIFTALGRPHTQVVP